MNKLHYGQCLIGVAAAVDGRAFSGGWLLVDPDS